MEQTYGFTEQAVNKIVEFAITRHIKQVDRLEAKLRFTWDKLAQGEVESLLIQVHGLYLPQALRTETLKLQIGQVKVKPLMALKGQIQLIQPAAGHLEIVVYPLDLTRALRLALQQDLATATIDQNARSLQPEDIDCLFLADQKIMLRYAISEQSATQSEPKIFTAKIQIQDRQELALSDVQINSDSTAQENGREVLSHDLSSTLIHYLDRMLSLGFFLQNGMVLELISADMTPERLLITAKTKINFFPR